MAVSHHVIEFIGDREIAISIHDENFRGHHDFVPSRFHGNLFSAQQVNHHRVGGNGVGFNRVFILVGVRPKSGLLAVSSNGQVQRIQELNGLAEVQVASSTHFSFGRNNGPKFLRKGRNNHVRDSFASKILHVLRRIVVDGSRRTCIEVHQIIGWNRDQFRGFAPLRRSSMS